jgi:hypothetical protein
MAYEIPGFSVTAIASADLSADQFKLVSLASTGKVAVTAATSTLAVLGILQDDPEADGIACQVMTSGISKAIAGETIAAGEFVCPSSVTAGRVDDADTATDRIIGTALTGGDVGEVISVLLHNSGAAVA